MFQRFDHVYWKQKSQFLLEEDRYDTWVLFAVEEGCFRFRIGALEGVAEPGTVVSCPSGIPFWRQTVEPVTFHFIRLDFGGYPPAGLHAGLLPIRSLRRLMENLRLLGGLDEGMDQAADPLKKHILRDLLYYCLEETGPELRTGPLPSTDSLMNEAMAIIRRQAGDVKFNVGDAARSVNLTPVQFSRRFQASFQLTPIRFLTECRIQMAKQLLTETEDTLEQIAVRCGYENGFYLSRVFKQVTRTSPSAYRKLYRV